MRIKQGFVMREVAGQTVIVATGEAARGFRGMIKVNAAGRIIWQGITDGLDEAAIVERIVAAFDVTRDTAEHDVAAFVAQMRDNGFLTA